jgi:ABC-type glycerol-3-phosphate transport system permease component
MTSCTSCGNNLAPDARFCPRCGASTAAPSQPLPSVPPINLAATRVQRHIQVAGVLWLVYAAERTLGGFTGMFFLHGIFGEHFHSNWGTAWTPMGSFGWHALWPVMIGSIAIGLVLALLTAYALLTRQSWGRIMAIVAGVLALMHPILGTGLGIYTLWVFAPYASGVEYAAIARPPLR